MNLFVIPRLLSLASQACPSLSLRVYPFLSLRAYPSLSLRGALATKQSQRLTYLPLTREGLECDPRPSRSLSGARDMGGEILEWT